MHTRFFDCRMEEDDNIGGLGAGRGMQIATDGKAVVTDVQKGGRVIM